MEDAHRWSVTYTNHVKQKRKIYHDGFLVLQSSRQKVMLYDEWDKLLESRFVKKEDVIRSGETLTSDSYLIDIGELCGGQQGTSISNCQEDRIYSEKLGPLGSYNSQYKKPMFVKSKGRAINLSPSHKIIRDFKKSEMNKFGSSPNCMDITKSSTREWQVLYTSQVTQKAKKFHDGFLELIVRGSQGRQVKLYDANRRHLDSRFLKKDETVCSGESLSFEGYLVEIGEQEGDHKPPTDITPQNKNCIAVGKTDPADRRSNFSTNKKLPAGKTADSSSQGEFTNLKDSSSKIENAKFSWGNAEPRRAVNDILSILRHPTERKVVHVNKLLADNHPESRSSDSQSNENHIQEFAEECKSSIKAIKLEAVEVVVAAGEFTVPENGIDSQARSSSFCLRSETKNHIAPTLNAECSNYNELNVEGQPTIESATLTRSNENEEPRNPPEIISHEEIITETYAPPISSLSFSKLSKVQEDNNATSSRCHEAASPACTAASNECTSHGGTDEKITKPDIHVNEMDEYPSFDLGI